MNTPSTKWEDHPVGQPPALPPWRRLATRCRYCGANATWRGLATRGVEPFADAITPVYDPTRAWDVCDAHSDRLFEEVEEVDTAFPIREAWQSWFFGHYLDSRAGRWLDRRLRPGLYEDEDDGLSGPSAYV